MMLRCCKLNFQTQLRIASKSLDIWRVKLDFVGNRLKYLKSTYRRLKKLSLDSKIKPLFKWRIFRVNSILNVKILVTKLKL
jgi:hypothetical protein